MASLVTAIVLVAARQTAAQQTPRFQAGVEVIPVDVTVVDDRGRPLQDLTVADFTVKIDGRPRRVVTAEWTSSIDVARSGAVRDSLPEGYQSNEQAANGRLIVIAIDQPSIGFTAVRPLRDTLNGFVDHLSPSDVVAVIGFGPGAPSISFTADRARIKEAIARMQGQQAPDLGKHSVGLSTSLALEQRVDDQCTPLCSDPALNRLVNRDCPAPNPNRPAERPLCVAEILREARAIALNARQEGEVTIRALGALFTALKGFDAPKTLLLVSQRFVMDRDRDGVGRVTALGIQAAESRTTIYSIRLDDETDISQRMQSIALTEDRRVAHQGLETLTSSARGALFNVAGTGAGIFDRIVSELSGYYLLGVEPDPADRDGKPHTLSVEVGRRGVTVRAQRTILDATRAAPRSPRQAAVAALEMPLVLSGLPLRSTAFVFRGSDPSKLQLLIHTDIGSGYTAPALVSIAYVVRDREGRTVDAQFTESRIPPAQAGVPSALSYEAGANVPPGDYTIKLAVADGDRVGTLELPIHAALLDAGAIKVTDLIAGGPVPPPDLLHPMVSLQIGFGMVQGYLEAYGADATTVRVRFEVVTARGGPPLLTTEVAARPAGSDRAIFSHAMAVQSLPPGWYQLQAVVSAGDAPIRTLARFFEIGPSADARTSAVAATAAPSSLPVPVDAKDLTPAFRLQAALDPKTTAWFRDHVTPAAKAAFDEGLTHLQTGKFPEAEISLRRALRDDADSVASLAYLGACFAASGHDTEARAVWRTALARDRSVAQIYEWLGQVLMRNQSFAEARAVFEQAAARWASDSRFAHSLAMLYAASGSGREAVQALERFLEENPGDTRATFLALQWLFTLHRAGAVVHGQKEDLQMARTYAARYARTGAPDQPLVKQWLEYLEKQP